ncbi:hypothetical protein TWF718_007910 [Orbilia javanica]|uniref:RNase III domain-containing protein n=1 Tax=Orbilia javanica TaxID=47235 RepID=A0AAN8RC12_9PEZI
MDISKDTLPILKVPAGMILPQIKSENLRTSALMDQSSRQPFTQRHLHVVGKRAYELAVSMHLVTAFPSVSNTKMAELNYQLTTGSEVIGLATQFDLHKNLYLYGTELGERAVSDAFHAWMGAVLVENGIAPICNFTSTLLEKNHQRIQSLGTGMENEAPYRQSIGNFGGQAARMLEEQENDEIAAMGIISASGIMSQSPSKRKLSYSNSKDSLISEPGEEPLLAGVDTMKRRKVAQLRPSPTAIFE